MIVVSDTTPLISLLKIDMLDLLEGLFGEVFIPVAVYDELTSNEKYLLEATQIQQKEFIRIKSVSNQHSVKELRRTKGLDLGESQAIVLTQEISADILLMDEAKGRKVSSSMGLKVMGTIGILIAAYEEGLITATQVKACIESLRRAGRHIGQRYYQKILDIL